MIDNRHTLWDRMLGAHVAAEEAVVDMSADGVLVGDTCHTPRLGQAEGVRMGHVSAQELSFADIYGKPIR